MTIISLAQCSSPLLFSQFYSSNRNLPFIICIALSIILLM